MNKVRSIGWLLDDLIIASAERETRARMIVVPMRTDGSSSRYESRSKGMCWCAVGTCVVVVVG